MNKKDAQKSSRRVVFTYRGEPGKTVILAGDFNHWHTSKKILADRKQNGIYSGTCLLPPGQYQYKFLVDGVWTLDDNNPNFVRNEFNTFNNIIDVE